MNRLLLQEAATVARFLDKEVINRRFTFESDRTLGEHSGIVDSLHLVDRDNPRERIKIWEQAYDG